VIINFRNISEFRVRFHHGTHMYPKPNTSPTEWYPPRPFTLCGIYEVIGYDEDGKPHMKPIKEVIVSQHPHDKYDRARGEREALKQAMASFDLDLRRAIWEAVKFRWQKKTPVPRRKYNALLREVERLRAAVKTS